MLDNWSSSGELGASLATGNSDTRTFAAGLALEKDGLTIRHKLNAAADILSNDTAVFIEGNGSLTNTTALTAKIFGALSARVAFNITCEEEPLVGLEKLDTLTRFTLVYALIGPDPRAG